MPFLSAASHSLLNLSFSDSLFPLLILKDQSSPPPVYFPRIFHSSIDLLIYLFIHWLVLCQQNIVNFFSFSVPPFSFFIPNFSMRFQKAKFAIFRLNSHQIFILLLLLIKLAMTDQQKSERNSIVGGWTEQNVNDENIKAMI